MAKFIKIHAAFRSEEEPDFEALGIHEKDEDFSTCDWDPVYINADHISEIFKNKHGYTNVGFISDADFTTCIESPEKIVEMIHRL